jgi:hypothetical protein|tara:strand:+ start:854 stop:1300 length:447 start_codon:yes stop_codon:yes gene_type:complete
MYHVAASVRQAKCCAYLIKKNADARIRNKAGKTPQDLATNEALKAALEPGQARAVASQEAAAAAPEAVVGDVAAVESPPSAPAPAEQPAPAEAAAAAPACAVAVPAVLAAADNGVGASADAAPIAKRHKASAKAVVPLHLLADDDDEQ